MECSGKKKRKEKVQRDKRIIDKGNGVYLRWKMYRNEGVSHAKWYKVRIDLEHR